MKWNRRFRSASVVVAAGATTILLATQIFLFPSLLSTSSADNLDPVSSDMASESKTDSAENFTQSFGHLDFTVSLRGGDWEQSGPESTQSGPTRTPDGNSAGSPAPDAKSTRTHTPLRGNSSGPLARTLNSVVLSEKLKKIFAGGEGSVFVLDPNTGDTLFSLEGDRVFTSASVYKLYTAYSILNEVDQGTLSMSSYLGGTTVANCLDDMIVYSDNECAAEWLFQKSYPVLTEQAESLGAKNTTFDVGDIETTPQDVAVFLAALYRGALLNDESTDLLLTMLENQIFRDGIPAALEPESVVADKIGFLGSLSHDAAIVYSPKGDYIVVIFTDDLNETDAITEAAAAVHEWI